MSLFIVERTLPGLTVRELGMAQLALVESARRFQAEGLPVRYLRSTLIRDQSRCLCLFEASNRDAVRKVNDVAQFPYSRIEEAIELDAPREPTQR